MLDLAPALQPTGGQRLTFSSFSLPLDVTKLGYSNSQNSGNTIKLIEVDGTVLIDGNGDPLDFSPDFA